MPILPQVFKAYDIRGLSPGELDTDFAYRLGQAFVKYTGAHTMVVGKDMRATTPELAAALTRGILSQGADVVDVGLVTSPMFYFAVADYELHDAGIMVTASHNPPEWNGFKLNEGDGMPIGGRRLTEEVRAAVEETPLSTKPEGHVVETDASDAYLEKVLSLADVSRLSTLRVVVDAGNGMAGVILPKLFDRIKTSVTPLYWDLDGTFPNHEANPLKEATLADLKTRVREERADLGIAYDGDADRVGFVDERGEFIPNDWIGALLVPEILARHPGAPILYDVRASNILREEIARAGGKPVVSMIGHGLIKPYMRRQGGAFAAELSGHFYFGDFYGVECADLVALMVMRIISRTGKKLSELVAPFGRYFHSGEINFTVGDKERLLEELEGRYGPKGNMEKIDGLRVDFPDWWFLVRASNTEPVVRLALEARTRELMEEKREELSHLISGFCGSGSRL